MEDTVPHDGFQRGYDDLEFDYACAEPPASSPLLHLPEHQADLSFQLGGGRVPPGRFLI